MYFVLLYEDIQKLSLAVTVCLLHHEHLCFTLAFGLFHHPVFFKSENSDSIQEQD